MTDSPFTNIPSGIGIAHYFFEETDRRNNGADGIDLFRDGADYCYLWVEAMIDHDMRESYLLDVRTSVGETGETRDFLFVNAGGGSPMQVEWQNEPIAFSADHEAHRDRGYKGLLWFVNRDDGAMDEF